MELQIFGLGGILSGTYVDLLSKFGAFLHLIWGLAGRPLARPITFLDRAGAGWLRPKIFSFVFRISRRELNQLDFFWFKFCALISHRYTWQRSEFNPSAPNKSHAGNRPSNPILYRLI